MIDAYKSGYQQYQQNTVLYATPEKLLIMLYDGALRFLKKARFALENRDLPAANACLIRVQDIFHELNASLDMNYAIAGNLRSLYSFINARLVEANLKKDVAILDEVEPLIEDLRNTWLTAAQNLRAKEGAANGKGIDRSLRIQA